MLDRVLNTPLNDTLSILNLKAPTPQNRQTNCFSVFGHFVGLALKEFKSPKANILLNDVCAS